MSRPTPITMEKLQRELAEAQRGCKMLADNATVWEERCDRLAEACAGIEQAYLEGSDSEWGHALMGMREALAAVKGESA